MQKFRKKPVVIEAFQWHGEPVEGFKRLPSLPSFDDGSIDYQLVIETLEGVMFANPGDWIIKGIKGEYYPCKPDIFEATYELVEGE